MNTLFRWIFGEPEETKRMREALEFYAERANWKRFTDGKTHWSNSPAADDRGALARRILESN